MDDVVDLAEPRTMRAATEVDGGAGADRGASRRSAGASPGWFAPRLKRCWRSTPTTCYPSWRASGKSSFSCSKPIAMSRRSIIRSWRRSTATELRSAGARP